MENDEVDTGSEVISVLLTLWALSLVLMLGFMDRWLVASEIQTMYAVCEKANSKLLEVEVNFYKNEVTCENGAMFSIGTSFKTTQEVIEK